MYLLYSYIGFLLWVTMVLSALSYRRLTFSDCNVSEIYRQVRATVLDELNKDYVIGARARGIKERTIVWAHVLKSSMLTIVTLLGLSLGSLLGGTAIVESIFMWPGVGKLAVDAISTRDYQVIQVYVIWMAIIYVAINLITDIVYHYLDPRIRIQGEGGLEYVRMDLYI